MGWDYYTYMSQPPFFIEEIRIFLVQESESTKRATNGANIKSQKPKGFNRYG